MNMNINKIQSKSIINKSNLPFSNLCINPYVGCMHSCLYCYATYMTMYSNHKNEKWGSFVDIKENAPDLLKIYLSKNSLKGNIVIGSVTDPYQPIEKNEKITRQILEILVNQQNQLSIFNDSFKISIITKSELILRDIDILKNFNNLNIFMSICTNDDKMAKIIEPFASSPTKRINTLSILKENNIKCGALISPYLPYITDYNILFNLLYDKIDFIYSEPINISGNIKHFVLDIYENYLNINNILDTINNKEYWLNINKQFDNLCQKYKITKI